MSQIDVKCICHNTTFVTFYCFIHFTIWSWLEFLWWSNSVKLCHVAKLGNFRHDTIHLVILYTNEVSCICIQASHFVTRILLVKAGWHWVNIHSTSMHNACMETMSRADFHFIFFTRVVPLWKNFRWGASDVHTISIYAIYAENWNINVRHWQVIVNVNKFDLQPR